MTSSDNQRSVVINGRFLGKPPSGVSRVGHELLRALVAEIEHGALDLRLRLAVPTGTAMQPSSPAIRVSERGMSGRLGEQLLPVVYPGATILSFCNVTPILARRSVVWIHDAHVFDAPETYPRLYRYWHHGLLAAARRRKFDVVTVSAFARERLMHHGVDPRRVRVVHNGGDHILRSELDTTALAAAGLTGQRFILVVGSPARHKNVPFAVAALLSGTDPALRIAVLGMSQQGPYRQDSPVGLHPRVVVLPRIDDGQLRALYAHAQAVLAPSLVEGFGLYAAEAMFADAGPLVLSNRGALPEVGGSAAIYFDPTDARALADAVTEALKPDTASRLRAAARIQREKFRWRRAAREVIEAYLS